MQLWLHIFPALGGSDYIDTSSDETFTPGSDNGAVRCLNVRILDDNAYERNHVFLLTLITADSNVILGTSVTEITILDNYGNVCIELSFIEEKNWLGL